MLDQNDNRYINFQNWQKVQININFLHFSPVFHPSSTYSAVLSEDSPPDTFVVQVSASDVDSGSYGQVSYFLLNDLETVPHFAINETTGVVRVTAPLDREIRSAYALTVRAVDDYDGHLAPGSHESTAVVSMGLIRYRTSPWESFQTFQRPRKSLWYFLTPN